MAFTTVTANISVDLQKPNVNEVVYVKQNDRLTRKVAVHVYDDGAAYSIPHTSLVKYAVRAIKPDGTLCVYETDENGSAAVTVSGNIATISIIQQAINAPGTVKMELVLQNTNESEILTSFAFLLKVEASALNGINPGHYIDPFGYLKNASVNQEGTQLIITKNNGETVTFSGGSGGGSGEGVVYLNYDTATYSSAMAVFQEGKLPAIKRTDTYGFQHIYQLYMVYDAGSSNMILFSKIGVDWVAMTERCEMVNLYSDPEMGVREITSFDIPKAPIIVTYGDTTASLYYTLRSKFRDGYMVYVDLSEGGGNTYSRLPLVRDNGGVLYFDDAFKSITLNLQGQWTNTNK